MISWRQLADQIDKMDDKELDMAVSFVVEAFTSRGEPAGEKVVDAEDGVEYAPTLGGLVPEGLTPGQPYIRLILDIWSWSSAL